MPLARKVPKLWPAMPEGDGDGVRPAGHRAVALGDLAGEHGADGAVVLLIGQSMLTGSHVVQGRLGLGDQLAVELRVSRPWSCS